MRVTVTGATGFIGSQLVDRLVAEGHDVTALVRHEHTTRPLSDRRVAVITGDVRDEDTVERAVRGADVVYHMARARAHVGAPATEVQSVNVTGTATVADASARTGVRVLVHCSSAAVYGARAPEPVTEATALAPDSAYARSKTAAEGLVQARARDGFAVVIARITAVLGPECRSWLPMMRSVARHRLPIIGAGTNWHHPADVSDIVDGLLLCAGRGVPSTAYNLAGPEPVRLRDLMECIARELGAKRPWSIPAAPVEWYLRLATVVERSTGVLLPSVAGARFLTSDRRLDLTRAHQELGFQPKVGVREMVRRTADWYRGERLLR